MEKNMIFLTLSTLPRLINGQIQTNAYCSEQGTCWYKGVSQLEAGTKYYLQSCAEKGVRIDKIVVIASEATRASEKRPEFQGKSALDVYSESILDYLNGVHFEERNFGFEIEDFDGVQEDGFKNVGMYEGVSRKDLIHIVEKDLSEQYIFDAIAEIKPETGEKTNLYLDRVVSETNQKREK